MAKQLLVLQGAGEGAHEEDARLVERLSLALGAGYDIAYPAMVNDGDAPYDTWKQFIDQELAKLHEPVILVGHSVGASVLLKYAAESGPNSPVSGLFLLATPYWGGEGWLYDGYEDLELPTGGAARLSQGALVHFFHCQDDPVIPAGHMELFRKILPESTFRLFSEGGHQFEHDLSPIVTDIRELERDGASHG